MLKRLKVQLSDRINKSDFFKNVLILLSGTFLSRLIPIAISPILTRMYTPDDFGVLGLFIAISSILGMVANGRYDVAILLPKEEKESNNLVALGILITSIFTLVVLFTIIIWKDLFLRLLNNNEIGNWIFLVPLVVFLLSIFSILSYYNIRRNKYKNISTAIISRSITVSSIQLVLGALKLGPTGLLSGYIASNFSGNLVLGKDYFHVLYNKLPTTKQLVNTAKTYINFPKFSLWAVMSSALVRHLNAPVLSNLFSITVVGHYTFLEKIIGLPSVFIGQSIGKVFLQKATEEKNNSGKAIILFTNTTKKLVFFAVPSFLFFYLFSPVLFEKVFGEQWRVAGEYAQILTPLFAIRFIVSPLSSIFYIFERQSMELKWQLGLLVITIINYIFAIFYNLDIEFLFYLISITISLYYVVLWYLLYRIAQGKNYFNI